MPHKVTFPLPPELSAHADGVALDLAFGDGVRFLKQWQAWRENPTARRMLHYVGIAAAQLGAPADHPLSAQLHAARVGLQPGIHRITFEGGAISLTLCIGETLQMLPELTFQADSVWMSGTETVWDKWAVKALTRKCRRGTRLHRTNGLCDTALEAHLRAAGFQCASEPAVYDPPWTLRTSRGKATPDAPVPSTCAVIGAGLAGASVAHALAVRGWQVTVFDTHPEPAGGASGLPVGLVVPHVSADDSPRSRLSRTGARLMLTHAQQRLSVDQDWAASGVMEHRSAVPPGGDALPDTLWHAQAGWIKPARLVRAWLDHPGITFLGNTPVRRLSKTNGHWLIHDAVDHEVGRTSLLIVANAMGCVPLLQDAKEPLLTGMAQQLDALHAMHGTLSMGTHTMNGPGEACDSLFLPFPPNPINGSGSLVPNVPTGEDRFWAAGATYDPLPADSATLQQQHQANWTRLHRLLPTLANALKPAFEANTVQAWSGQRCVTHDRLPLVGPLTADATAWICVGLGSRGLSFSALCAELLVARIGSEPLPIEASLARSLDAARPQRSVRLFAKAPTPGAD